mmetsp:Transcript_30302/g.84688  ORF Transcript_30302/g.84688 Transcript_30302/m.84688 type:complete len:241 (-) Transcript_30302:530-1252(-)
MSEGSITTRRDLVQHNTVREDVRLLGVLARLHQFRRHPVRRDGGRFRLGQRGKHRFGFGQPKVRDAAHPVPLGPQQNVGRPQVPVLHPRLVQRPHPSGNLEGQQPPLPGRQHVVVHVVERLVQIRVDVLHYDAQVRRYAHPQTRNNVRVCHSTVSACLLLHLLGVALPDGISLEYLHGHSLSVPIRFLDLSKRPDAYTLFLLLHDQLPVRNYLHLHAPHAPAGPSLHGLNSLLNPIQLRL